VTRWPPDESPEHADVIAAAVEQLPVGEAVRAPGEHMMLDKAAGLDATDLARTGRHLVHDPREAGARMWDALIQTARHGLDTELPPESRGAARPPAGHPRDLGRPGPARSALCLPRL
jgi:hypothetical protein